MRKFYQKNRSLILLLLVVTATSVVTSAFFLTFFTTPGKSSGGPSSGTGNPEITPITFNTGADSSWQQAIIDVNKRVAPAVVYIDTVRTVKTSPVVPDFFRDFFGPDFFRNFNEREYQQQGTGSGFIIREDGYVVTNYHVIENADKVTVNLKEGKQYKAKVIGTDQKYDLAILKIEAKNLPYLEIGDSD